jgi:hypothetical protein
MNTGAMLYSLNKIRSQITATARYLDGLIQHIEQEKPFWSVCGADPRKIREEILRHHRVDEHDAFDNMPPILERELTWDKAGIRSRRPLVGSSGKHLRKILTTNPIKYRRKGHTRHRCPEPCGRGFIGRQNQVFCSKTCGVRNRKDADKTIGRKSRPKRGR